MIEFRVKARAETSAARPWGRPSRSYMTGRNGYWEITAIEVRQFAQDFVTVDGIGQRGAVIKGGFDLSLEAMDKLCNQWIAERTKQYEEEIVV